MDQLDLEKSLESFDFSMEEASVVCHKTDDLIELIKTAPEENLNNTTMQVLYQAIEGLQERSGVFYNTIALESAQTHAELKTVTLEGLKEFAASVWEAIKKAVMALYNKIKEYFTSGEKAVKDMASTLKQAKDKHNANSKGSMAPGGVVMELAMPSPYLIHKTLYSAVSPVKTTTLTDVISNLNSFTKTSQEHSLVEGIDSFRTNIDKLIDDLDDSSFDTTILDKVFAVMSNYSGDKPITAGAVAGMREHKDVITKREFDSTYASKRYSISFGVNKKKVDENSTALVTDQVLSRVHVSRDAEKLIVKNVSAKESVGLVTTLESSLDYLTKKVDTSKKLLKLISQIQDLMSDIDAGKYGQMNSGHVLTLSIVIKAINAVIKLFGSMQTEYGKVVKEHLNLYMRMASELKGDSV